MFVVKILIWELKNGPIKPRTKITGRGQFCLRWTVLSTVDSFVYGGQFCLQWTWTSPKDVDVHRRLKTPPWTKTSIKTCQLSNFCESDIF